MQRLRGSPRRRTGRRSAARQGSAGCFVSCDSPRVTLVYRTDAPPAEACEEARQAVESEIGPTIDDPDLAGWCGWSTAVPEVDDRAFVMAGADDATALRRDLGGGDWRTLVPPAGTGTIVWVEFDSGLD